MFLGLLLLYIFYLFAEQGFFIERKTLNKKLIVISYSLLGND